MIMAGTESQRMHGRGGNDDIGNGLRHRVEGFGRALKGLDTARADGREHGPHQPKAWTGDCR
jgi:hypothetical protein